MGPKERIVITIRVTTNHPIKAYGGIRLSEEILEQIAERLRLNLLPMVNQHDPMQRIDSHCLRAEVIDLPDGFKAVEADLEVDAEAWQAVEAEWGAAQAPGGFSFSCSEWFEPESKADLGLAADAYYFKDDDIRKAAEIMSAAGTVKSGRLYQFAAVPPPHIVIDLTAALAGIPVSVLGAAIYDGLKYLLLRMVHHGDRSENETQIDFYTRRDAKDIFSQTVQIRSANEEVLKHAIDRIGDAIESPNSLLLWHEEDMEWEAPD